MVSRDRLKARLSALDPSVSTDGPWVDAVVGMTLQPLGHRPIYLPRGLRPPWSEDAEAQAEVFMPTCGVPSLLELLTNADRVYEAVAAPGERRVLLLSAQQMVGGVPTLLVASLAGRVSKKTLDGCGAFGLRAAHLDSDEYIDLLTGVAGELTDASFVERDPDGAVPRFALIGEIDTELQRLIRRRLWAHGIRLTEEIRTPARNLRSNADRLATFKVDGVVFVREGCGPDIGALLARIPTNATPIILEGAEPDLQELELDVALEDFVRPERSEASSNATAEFEDAVLALEGPSFRLTPACKKRLRTCPYPDLPRMLDHLQRLRRLADAWHEAQGSVNSALRPLAAETEGIDLEMHDGPLAASGGDRCDYEGATLSREPHVRVDDAKPFKECGRIYFCLDRGNWRFVVDHIGLHL